MVMTARRRSLRHAGQACSSVSLALKSPPDLCLQFTLIGGRRGCGALGHLMSMKSGL